MMFLFLKKLKGNGICSFCFWYVKAFHFDLDAFLIAFKLDLLAKDRSKSHIERFLTNKSSNVDHDTLKVEITTPDLSYHFK